MVFGRHEHFPFESHIFYSIVSCLSASSFQWKVFMWNRRYQIVHNLKMLIVRKAVKSSRRMSRFWRTKKWNENHHEIEKLFIFLRNALNMILSSVSYTCQLHKYAFFFVIIRMSMPAVKFLSSLHSVGISLKNSSHVTQQKLNNFECV